MKQYHVYELFDQEGTIVYVGMSSNPKVRFNKHIGTKPGYGNGKFYGRTDLDIRIVSIHSIKKEATLFTLPVK
jgi:predicted GIY-YIG superfamily endonuclease